MIKIVLYVSIVLFTTFVGYLLPEKWRMRATFYTQMANFHRRYLEELEYKRRSVKELFSKENNEFSKQYVIFEKENKVNFKYITEDERSFVFNYFSEIGKGDVGSQKELFVSKNEAIVRNESMSIAKSKQMNGLGVKMGLLTGLLIVILIM